MKYAIVTFGCRVNQADSLAIEGTLRDAGAEPADVTTADVVVVNTCSVTASADQGARQTIRRISRDNPGVKVVVTGCYATRRPDEILQLPNVTRVVPNTRKDSLADEILDGAWAGCGRGATPGTAGRTALSLRVQTGCDEACSYCIIPTTRGPGQSKAIDTVLADVRRGIAAGYKEIWITGVHLGSFGRDRRDDASLVTLLERLARVDEDVLFRVSSLEPMDCSREVIDLIAESPRLAPHLHLPLQHGSDAMLTAMRRPYTAAYYNDLIQHIARRMPHASIGSDVIVGFPGEGDGHFDDLIGLLRTLPLAYLHVFPYSDRPGTEASRLPEKVDGAVIRTRGSAVRAIGADMAGRFRRLQAGAERRALTVDDGRSAVTDNYLKVPLDQAQPRNSWITVRLKADTATPADVLHCKTTPADVVSGFSRT